MVDMLVKCDVRNDNNYNREQQLANRFLAKTNVMAFNCGHLTYSSGASLLNKPGRNGIPGNLS